MEFKNIMKVFKGEKRQGVERLSHELDSQLKVLKEYVPLLEPVVQAANLNNFYRTISPDSLMSNPMISQIPDGTLRKKVQAEDEVRIAFHRVVRILEKYTATTTEQQFVRVQQRYEEFRQSFKDMTLGDLPARLEEEIAWIRNLTQL